VGEDVVPGSGADTIRHALIRDAPVVPAMFKSQQPGR
jgi:hypothetical protein